MLQEIEKGVTIGIFSLGSVELDFPWSYIFIIFSILRACRQFVEAVLAANADTLVRQLSDHSSTRPACGSFEFPSLLIIIIKNVDKLSRSNSDCLFRHNFC